MIDIGHKASTVFRPFHLANEVDTHDNFTFGILFAACFFWNVDSPSYNQIATSIFQFFGMHYRYQNERYTNHGRFGFTFHHLGNAASKRPLRVHRVLKGNQILTPQAKLIVFFDSRELSTNNSMSALADILTMPQDRTADNSLP